jgi:peptidoglycan/xylan/chitin deacetylase (PgdA/CDA1 family)
MALLGSPIRVVPCAVQKRLYLTFDDGPGSFTTPAILQALGELGTAATFFLVAERARRVPHLVREIIAAGHAIGNHSLDHAYHHYFRGWRHLRTWIARAEQELSDLAGCPTVGFRPPAGVRTPELAWALDDLGLPLVLWRVRFFDTLLPWHSFWAVNSLRITPPGAIVLLHEVGRARRLAAHVETLKRYITAARQSDYTLDVLSRAVLAPLSGKDRAQNSSRSTEHG